MRMDEIMNEIMKVSTIDAARTTNLPPMEVADMITEWHNELGDKESAATHTKGHDPFDAKAAASE